MSQIGFVICTERGRLEQKSTLLIQSLRRFGGRLKDAPVYSFSPRRGHDITPGTERCFREHGVHHCSEVLNTRFLQHGVNNKPFVARHAEENLDHEILVFIDSDQIIVGEPSLLLLPPDSEAAARPVDRKGVEPNAPDDPERDYWERIYEGARSGIGASGPADPDYDYWMNLYAIGGVATPDYVETTVDQQRIFSYWNSGLVAVRREMRLFSRWHDIFVEAMERGLVPTTGGFYVEQSTLAVAFRAAGARIHLLPVPYNYPVPLQSMFRRESSRIDRIDGLVTIHYHDLFDRPGRDHPLAALAADPRTRDEIDEILRRSGVWPVRRRLGLPGWLKPPRRLRAALGAHPQSSSDSGG